MMPHITMSVKGIIFTCRISYPTKTGPFSRPRNIISSIYKILLIQLNTRIQALLSAHNLRVSGTGM
jgi:hypothetical protein